MNLGRREPRRKVLGSLVELRLVCFIVVILLGVGASNVWQLGWHKAALALGLVALPFAVAGLPVVPTFAQEFVDILRGLFRRRP